MIVNQQPTLHACRQTSMTVPMRQHAAQQPNNNSLEVWYSPQQNHDQKIIINSLFIRHYFSHKIKKTTPNKCASNLKQHSHSFNMKIAISSILSVMAALSFVSSASATETVSGCSVVFDAVLLSVRRVELAQMAHYLIFTNR